jgi:hypothetical protein
LIDYLIAEYQAANEIAICNALTALRNEIVPYLNINSAKGIIESYCHHNTDTHELSDRFSQPSPLFQLYNLTSSLRLYFEEPVMLQSALQESMDSLVKKLIKASSHQLKVLFKALQKAIAVIGTKHSSTSPIIILELPLGNTIPCRLLSHLLEQKDIPYEIVNVSLNRNDTKKAGFTRRQLLQEKLSIYYQALLVYIDEWILGSNFDTITGILAKFKGITTLPIALLEYEASTRPDFNKYSEHHEEHCKAVGEDSHSLRFIIPKLNEKIYSEQPFIWVEHDRIAGYRKFDFVGNFIYTMKELIGSIIDKPAILDQFLDQLPAEHQLYKEQARAEIVKQCENFVGSYWPKWESIIRQNCLFNNEEPEQIVASALTVLQNTADFADVQFAVESAKGLLSQHTDATNRYPFKELVPYCESLTGGELLAHQLFMKECFHLFYS